MEALLVLYLLKRLSFRKLIFFSSCNPVRDASFILLFFTHLIWQQSGFLSISYCESVFSIVVISIFPDLSLHSVRFCFRKRLIWLVHPRKDWDKRDGSGGIWTADPLGRRKKWRELYPLDHGDPLKLKFIGEIRRCHL